MNPTISTKSRADTPSTEPPVLTTTLLMWGKKLDIIEIDNINEVINLQNRDVGVYFRPGDYKFPAIDALVVRGCKAWGLVVTVDSSGKVSKKIKNVMQVIRNAGLEFELVFVVPPAARQQYENFNFVGFFSRGKKGVSQKQKGKKQGSLQNIGLPDLTMWVAEFPIDARRDYYPEY